jgi:hypothetical protein
VTAPFYEVRCENCRTTFPPETKRCIHCGGPLGTGLGALLRPRGGEVGRPPPGAPDEDEESLAQGPARSVLWVVTALLAVGISLLRSCMER